MDRRHCFGNRTIDNICTYQSCKKHYFSCKKKNHCNHSVGNDFLLRNKYWNTFIHEILFSQFARNGCDVNVNSKEKCKQSKYDSNSNYPNQNGLVFYMHKIFQNKAGLNDCNKKDNSDCYSYWK